MDRRLTRVTLGLPSTDRLSRVWIRREVVEIEVILFWFRRTSVSKHGGDLVPILVVSRIFIHRDT